MTVEEALEIVDKILDPKRLSSVQELVFRYCWEGQTYQEIAQSSGYDGDYVRIVGSRLWQALAKPTGEKITKNNIQAVLRQYSGKGSKSTVISSSSELSDRTQISRDPSPEFPGGPRPLTCPYYVECPTITEDCYREISKPGALIRIKAPEKRGKSSLTIRILTHAESLNYQTVRLNLQQVEGEALKNLNRFLRWFCASITQQLQLEPKLDDYWDADLGSKISCTSYLQGYVLAQLDHPLAINLKVWAKLRLIVVYSTEIYIPLDLNQSPFNVGLPIQIPKFSFEQTETLALRYDLTSNDDMKLNDLMSLHTMVNGHPYLLNLAFYHLSRQDLSIGDLLRDAPTQTSIYSEHLRSHLIMIQDSPILSTAFKEVVMADAAVQLDAVPAYQLESMGLVTLDGDRAAPSCDLYRLYFRDRLT